jgi:acetyl esterase
MFRLALSIGLTAFLAVAPAKAAVKYDGPANLPPSEGSNASQPETLSGAESLIYKTVGGANLRLHIFSPDGHTPSQKKPAIIFFFGGGYISGTIMQFVPQAKYLAARGMVAAVADYRVTSRHGSTPSQSIADGRDSIRYLRKHAADLGIDPQRIVAAGGSAGGNLALAAAILGADDSGVEGSATPDALLLFNPVVVSISGGFSPLQELRTKLPPTQIMVGANDTTTKPSDDKAFCSKALALGGAYCDVSVFEGGDHGFFNPAVQNERWFWPTLVTAARFLERVGYIEK